MTDCYLRFFNACNDKEGLNIHLNDTAVANDLGFMQFSEFWNTEHGIFLLKIERAGDTTAEPLYDAPLELLEGHVYTLALTYEHDRLLITIIGDSIWHDIKRPNLVIANLTGHDTSLDIELSQGGEPKEVDGLFFRDATPAMPLNEGRLDISLKQDGQLIGQDHVELDRDMVYMGILVSDGDSIGLIMSDDWPVT